MPYPSSNQPMLSAALQRVHSRMQQRFAASRRFIGRLPFPKGITRGKKLRVQLVLLAANACGHVNAQVEQLATALEFFHYATLIHDDVIDRSERRRHLPTLNMTFGNEMAVVMGDWMFTQVLNMLMHEIPKSIRTLIAKTASQVCYGEIRELQLRGQRRVALKEYQQVIGDKTASLFSTCCEGGARLAGGSLKQIKALRKYGEAFGMAFQIQDDLLDLFGMPKQVGKSLGLDLKDGRMTLPVILGLKRLRGPLQAKLWKAIEQGPKHLNTIQKTLKACGALEDSRTMAADYARQAEQAAYQLPPTPARAALLKLARFAVERKF